ncbi:predicted protein [Coccidioides posadasii str. Silveira]|uniref:Predicted protein n=2 Tax=Coccidioides posadasii TaxID=199306 RepID=E9DIY2_COCPS|nr:predicted protein [Coccidioides posadasii str. Silveira]KMM65967.1 hypothetical protein CPAG_02308 [Coccidioides posadasii RMSCC 3488]
MHTLLRYKPCEECCTEYRVSVHQSRLVIPLCEETFFGKGAPGLLFRKALFLASLALLRESYPVHETAELVPRLKSHAREQTQRSTTIMTTDRTKDFLSTPHGQKDPKRKSHTRGSI